MDRYDIIIIGSGPAGVSAAITAKVRNKRILLLGNQSLSSKIEKAHRIQNYPGLPEMTGKELQNALRNHLQQMDIEVTEERVNAVYAMGNYFAVQGHQSNYEALSVIVAVGTTVMKPYPGELEYLGRGVSYCATCDAALYGEKTAAVVAFSREEESEAAFLAERAKKVYYVPMYQDSRLCGENIEIVADVRPERIEREENGMCLVTSQGSIAVDGVFLLREYAPPAQLVPGLKVTEHSIEVDRQMQTNIKGLFACGDITGAPYQYIKAAGEGNVAALSAVAYLAGISA